MFRKAICAAVISVSLSGLANAQTVSIGTNPQGTLAYAIGSAVSKVAIENADIRMRVVPQGGPTVTLPLVNAGALDFSIANSVAAAFAPEGEEIFHSPNENLRVVARLVPLYSGFLVRKDSDIETLEDLEGKRVTSGYLKQKIVGINSRAVLNTVGLSNEDLELVPVPNGVRGVEDFETGNADAAFFSLSSGRTQQAEAATGGIRTLHVDDSAASIEKLNEISPGATVTIQGPDSNLTGVDEDQGVFTASFMLMTSASVSDDVVYELTKSLYENKEALAASASVFNNFDVDNMNNYENVEFHAGALRFYEEQGL